MEGPLLGQNQLLDRLYLKPERKASKVGLSIRPTAEVAANQKAGAFVCPGFLITLVHLLLISTFPIALP